MDTQSILSSPAFHDTQHLQRFLKGLGHYAGALDGLLGPKTRAAAVRFESVSTGIANAFGSFDARSEREIFTLHPDAQRLCRGLLTALRANGLDARVLCGMRSYAQQNALYSQGRTKAGAVVTRATGGNSFHNFGVAFDIGLFSSGKYLQNADPYLDAARIGKHCGLECGAFWQSFSDPPHYQLLSLPPLSLIRKRFEAGFPLFQSSTQGDKT
ncbi:hypothetical protein SIID45300_01039 [Candidatus Magnetaquicoccaceae bacterium FCR-1]|uniref:D-alanyl-D-alanine carboxypeptidase-like core domain-containing protein n=1 Tax=Candidatus Magnetaquiglobus chichijimensis TaxID=3141448 RepID=A0ABQ0C763_9PROT